MADEKDSESWRKQRSTEETILKILFKHGEGDPVLTRETHKTMLRHSLSSLPAGYRSLDASRPWVVYWITGALSLLAKKGDKTIPKELEERVIDFFGRCQSPTGGFGGGPGQLPHFAPTYAAVNAIASIGTKEAYQVVNRKTMLQFLLKMKQEDGSFRMHDCGEADVRSTYCALSVASVLNLLTPAVRNKASQYIASCQTFEGGFGGEPFNEAHGGYTFCGLAGSIILGSEEEIDIPSLLHFVTDRQMRVEGGFQGRANKLVDSCYSFWQGSSFPMLNSLPSFHHLSMIPPQKQTKPEQVEPHHHQQSVLGWYQDKNTLFNREDLQKYILICCQDQKQGGFRDKPPMGKDLYHTFYSLAGLSIAQHSTGGEDDKEVLGGEENMVGVVHPVYGVEIERLEKAKEYFLGLEKEE